MQIMTGKAAETIWQMIVRHADLVLLTFLLSLLILCDHRHRVSDAFGDECMVAHSETTKAFKRRLTFHPNKLLHVLQCRSHTR